MDRASPHQSRDQQSLTPTSAGAGVAGGGAGTVYLLHFDRPYRHARHYQGWTADLSARLAEHAAGRGARLLAVIHEAGIGWALARTWSGGRSRERQLKNQGGASRRCPDCGVRPRRQANEFCVAEDSSAGDAIGGQPTSDPPTPALAPVPATTPTSRRAQQSRKEPVMSDYPDSELGAEHGTRRGNPAESNRGNAALADPVLWRGIAAGLLDELDQARARLEAGDIPPEREHELVELVERLDEQAGRAADAAAGTCTDNELAELITSLDATTPVRHLSKQPGSVEYGSDEYVNADPLELFHGEQSVPQLRENAQAWHEAADAARQASGTSGRAHATPDTWAAHNPGAECAAAEDNAARTNVEVAGFTIEGVTVPADPVTVFRPLEDCDGQGWLNGHLEHGNRFYCPPCGDHHEVRDPVHLHTVKTSPADQAGAGGELGDSGRGVTAEVSSTDRAHERGTALHGADAQAWGVPEGALAGELPTIFDDWVAKRYRADEPRGNSGAATAVAKAHQAVAALPIESARAQQSARGRADDQAYGSTTVDGWAQ